MAKTFARFTPHRRSSISTAYPNVAIQAHRWTHWFLELDTNTTYMEFDGLVPAWYAGEAFNISVLWTVPSGVTGNLNLGGNIRRFIDNTEPSSPYSAGFGTGVQSAPAAGVLKAYTNNMTGITKAATAPLFPGGLGGWNAGERYRIQFSRTGGTTLTGVALIKSVEIWIP